MESSTKFHTFRLESELVGKEAKGGYIEEDFELNNLESVSKIEISLYSKVNTDYPGLLYVTPFKRQGEGKAKVKKMSLQDTKVVLNFENQMPKVRIPDYFCPGWQLQGPEFYDEALHVLKLGSNGLRLTLVKAEQRTNGSKSSIENILSQKQNGVTTFNEDLEKAKIGLRIFRGGISEPEMLFGTLFLDKVSKEQFS